MSAYDDVDSPDYRDTNVGEGFVESEEDRKEIDAMFDGFHSRIRSLESENAKLRAEVDRLTSLLHEQDQICLDKIAKAGRLETEIERLILQLERAEVLLTTAHRYMVIDAEASGEMEAYMKADKEIYEYFSRRSRDARAKGFGLGERLG